MSAILLDTHVWAWSLTADSRLSARAVGAMASAATVYVSAISFFEVAQNVRLGKWPEMLPYADHLPSLLEEQGGAVAGLDASICLAAGLMAWTHRDPFDRLLAATALRRDVPIISADTAFDGVVTRIW